jgi:bacterioferritin-associated ferredoxin
MKNWEKLDNEEIVCYCKNVNKKTIIDAINKGFDSLDKIKRETSACTGGRCKELNPSGKCCSGDIISLINIYSDKKSNLIKLELI